MKKTILRVVSSIVAASLFVSQIAAAATVPCGPVATRIGFTNGVQNTREDARRSLRELSALAVRQGLPVTAPELFYHTKGRPGHEDGKASMKLDVLEVYWQLAQEQVGNDPAKEAQVMAIFHHAVTSSSTGGGTFATLVASLAKAESDAEANAFTAQTAANVKLETTNDVQHLTSILSTGDRLMMAAHSQGTLWANAALQDLTAQHPRYAQRVHLVNAGMAADHVWQTPGSAYPNVYVTNTHDTVMNTLRALAVSKGLPPPAAANSDFGLTSSDNDLGHGFLEVYIKQGYDPGTKVTTAFKGGFTQVTAENNTPPVLVSFDVDMNIGPAGQVALANGTWQQDETPETLTGPTGETIAWGKYTRTGPQTYHAAEDIYCSFIGPKGFDAKAVDIPLYVSMPNNLPAPMSVQGSVTFTGATNPVIQARHVIPDGGYNDYAFAHVVASRTNNVTSADMTLY